MEVSQISVSSLCADLYTATVFALVCNEWQTGSIEHDPLQLLTCAAFSAILTTLIGKSGATKFCQLHLCRLLNSDCVCSLECFRL